MVIIGRRTYVLDVLVLPPRPGTLSRGPSFTQAGAVFSIPDIGAKRCLADKPRHAMRYS